jgi:hypothetical protein
VVSNCFLLPIYGGNNFYLLAQTMSNSTKDTTNRYYNEISAMCDPWMRLWAAFLLRAIYDRRNKKTSKLDRSEAEELLKSSWVQQMALDINGINLQELVK